MPNISVVDGFLPKLEMSQAKAFEYSLTKEEIEEVVWSCYSMKSLGYDGFNTNFIRKMWQVVEADTSRLIILVFETA